MNKIIKSICKQLLSASIVCTIALILYIALHRTITDKRRWIRMPTVSEIKSMIDK